MTKEQLIKYIDPEQKHIDVAVPLPWAIKMREEGVDPSRYAWSYEHDKVNGRPVNLMEVELQMHKETIQDLLKANAEFVEKINALEKNIRKQKVFG